MAKNLGLRRRVQVSRVSRETGEKEGRERERDVQDARQQLQLPARPNQTLINHPTGVHLILNTLKQIRMLTNLPQLHQLVAQPLHARRLPPALPSGPSIRNHLELLHLLVQLRLQRAHPDLDDLLDLVRELALDVLLQAAQQERAEHLMQTANNEERLLLVQLDLVARARVGEGRVEPFVERLDRVEDLGEHEVQLRPELGKVVLQGRAG